MARHVTPRHVTTRCLAHAFWHSKRSWRACHDTRETRYVHAAQAQVRRSLISRKQPCKCFATNDSFIDLARALYGNIVTLVLLLLLLLLLLWLSSSSWLSLLSFITPRRQQTENIHKTLKPQNMIKTENSKTVMTNNELSVKHYYCRERASAKRQMNPTFSNK